MEVGGQFSDLILFAHYMALRDQTENVRLGREHLHLLNPLTEPYVMHLHKLNLTLGVYFRYGLLPRLVYLDHHNNYVKKKRVSTKVWCPQLLLTPLLCLETWGILSSNLRCQPETPISNSGF